MGETLREPDGTVIPSNGHATNCNVFFAPTRGCSCAVAREVRMRALLLDLRPMVAEMRCQAKNDWTTWHDRLDKLDKLTRLP